MSSSLRQLTIAIVVGVLLVAGGQWSGGARLYGATGWGTGFVTSLLDGMFTADDLVEELLGGPGSGISFSNVSFTGNLQSAGRFRGAPAAIGITNGLILSSGKVEDVVGPNGSDNTTTTFCAPNCAVAPGGDPDLQTLIPAFPTFDASILEFDFNPGPADNVRFRYVFTSDEYNEFSNRLFNNVFGFFVNGVNYALLPDAITVVSINNVNGGNPLTCTDGVDNDGDDVADGADSDCTSPGDNIVGEDNVNSAFYINNDCSDPDGNDLACPIDIEADGLTVVLTLTAPVRPNDSTNHIRLGIADAGDSFFDSWVLLEAGSFKALPPELCAPGGGPNGVNEDGDEFTDEGCSVEGEDNGTGQFTTAGDNTATYAFSFASFGSPLDTTLDIREDTVLRDHDLRFFAVLRDPRDVRARLVTKPGGPFYVTTNCVPLKPGPNDPPDEPAMCVEYIATGAGGLGSPPPQPGIDFDANVTDPITWLNSYSTNLRGSSGGPPLYGWGAGHNREDVDGDQFTEDIMKRIIIDNDSGMEVSDSFSSMVIVYTPNLIEEATSPAGATVQWNPMFTPDLTPDNPLDNPQIACTPRSGTTFPLGTTQVTCTGTFETGNASGVFHVTVVDTTAPTFSAPLPASRTVEATGPSGARVTFDVPTATDIADTTVEVSCSHAPDTTVFPLGPTQVTCTATDGFNQASHSFTVTVVDTTPPTFDLPLPVIRPVEATGPGTPVTFPLPTATDLVDTSVEVSCLPASDSPFAVGETEVTCTAIDDFNNPATVVFTVTVVDTTPPVFDPPLPGDRTVEATGPAGAVVTFPLPTASDLVDTTVEVFCSPQSGSGFRLGATEVICTASDGFNQTIHRFTITVRDTTPPIVMVPADITAPALRPDGTPVSFMASAADTVSGALPVSCLPASGSIFPIGSTTVTCTATDAAGNTGAATFVVRITNDPTPGQMDGEGHIIGGPLRYGFEFQILELFNGKAFGRFELRVCEPDRRKGRRERGDRDDRDHHDGDNDDCGRDGSGRGNRFESRALTFVRFSDDPAFVPGKHWFEQRLPDTLVVAGTGRWNGRNGYRFEVKATDQGEPGRGRDTFEVVITAPDGKVVAMAAGKLASGNVQSFGFGRHTDD